MQYVSNISDFQLANLLRTPFEGLHLETARARELLLWFLALRGPVGSNSGRCLIKGAVSMYGFANREASQMSCRASCIFALVAVAATPAFAEDQELETALAAKGDYYSEAKVVICSNTYTCVVAHTKVPKGKILLVTHASCSIGHASNLIALSLTRNTVKDIPNSDPVTPLVVLEKQASGSLSDGSVNLSGYNQDISYRIRSGLFPIMYAQQQSPGFLSMGCILTGKLE